MRTIESEILKLERFADRKLLECRKHRKAADTAWWQRTEALKALTKLRVAKTLKAMGAK